MQNGRTPAGFRPNGLPLGRQSRCRLAPSNPLKAKVDGWGWKLWQALVGPPASPVSTHAKRQNHSRIQAQRVATWSAEPVPFSTFEPAKNKAGWVGLEACGGGWMELIGLGCRNMADGWTCHYNRPWLPEHGGWMDAPLLMEGAS